MTDVAVNKQFSDGSFPNGHNGPYGDEETNVRNTAHWLITMSILIRKYGMQKYDKPARKALAYLLSGPARPMGAAYFNRKNPFKDSSNGLVGQAWVMESLNEAHKALHDARALQVARDVYNQHKFEEMTDCWLILGVDGGYRNYDLTYNHQLWFASIALEVFREDEPQYQQALCFFDNASKNLDCYHDGIIFHGSKLNSWRNIRKFGLINMVQIIRTYTKWRKLREKSVGYHTFNLFAFCRIYKLIPQHNFWRTRKWQKIYQVVSTKTFWETIRSNNYGWAYNNPGVESLSVNFLENQEKSNAEFLREIINNSYNDKNGSLMDKQTDDSETSNARVYELLMLPVDLKTLVIRL